MDRLEILPEEDNVLENLDLARAVVDRIRRVGMDESPCRHERATLTLGQRVHRRRRREHVRKGKEPQSHAETGSQHRT